jgi:iron complex outermembrane recepter protein
MSNKPLSNIRALAVSIAALSCAAPFSWAAGGAIEEVMVTAQKRAENLQTTPIAISALSADALEKMGIADFADVAQASPSIHFTTYPSSNMLTLYMRGQGINDPMQITADGSVGLYQDGFYVGRPLGAIFELADLERVEVLRGPQGTLYGRNTTGGAVNMISKRPSGEFGFKQSFNVGTRDLFRSLTTIDLPAWNDLAAKLTVLKSSRDGNVKNSGNSNDYGASEQLSGRLDLHWQASDALSADYFFENGTLNSTPLYFQNAQVQQSGRVAGYTQASSPRDTTYRAIDLPESTSRFENHGLTLGWDISDSFTVKSLTGYRELKVDGYQDYAEALGTGVSTNAITALDIIHSHTFSQEFQFIGSALEDRIRYVSGLYYYRDSASHYEDFFTGINATPTFASRINKLRDVHADAQSLAAYGQVTWKPDILQDRFEATLGGRFTRDKRKAERKLLTSIGRGPLFGGGPITVPGSTDSGVGNDQNFSRFNPALTLNYAWSDDFSTYAKVATGYRAGGSSEAAPVGSFGLTYGPEKIISYEAGLKSYWFDQRVRFNAAAFVSKIDDMQMLISTSPADSSVVQGFNAGKATIKGLEFDLLVQPLDDLSLILNYAYLHTQLDSVAAPAKTIFDRSSNPLSPYAAGDDISGLFVVPNAPRHAVTASADYTLWHFDSSDIAAHLDYRWQSHMYTSALGGADVPDQVDVGVGAYGILNGKLTWAFDLPRGDRAKLSVWGKNLTDQYYAAQVIGLGGGPVNVAAAAPGNTAGRKATAEAWSEPPSYGVEIIYEY